MTLTFTVRRLLKADRLLLYSGSSLPSAKFGAGRRGVGGSSPSSLGTQGAGRVSCTLGRRGHIYNWHP